MTTNSVISAQFSNQTTLLMLVLTSHSVMTTKKAAEVRRKLRSTEDLRILKKRRVIKGCVESDN